MRYCAHCAAALEEGATVCPDCGKPVENRDEPEQIHIPEVILPEALEKTREMPPEELPAMPKPISVARQPVYYIPAKEPVPEKKKKRSVFSVLASVLLCVLMILTVLTTFALGVLESSLDKEHYLEMIQSIDPEELSGALVDPNMADVSFYDALCVKINQAGQRYNFWKDLTADNLETLLEETDIPEFAAEQMERLTKAVLSGKDSFRIRPNDVLELLENNLGLLSQDMGLFLNDQMLEQVAAEILTATGADEISLRPEGPAGQLLDLVRGVLSSGTLMWLMGVTGALAVLLILVNLYTPMCGVRDIGIVGIVTGTLGLGMRLVPFFLPDLGEWGHLAAAVLGSLLKDSASTALPVLVGGLLLTILGSVILMIQKRRTEKT